MKKNDHGETMVTLLLFVLWAFSSMKWFIWIIITSLSPSSENTCGSSSMSKSCSSWGYAVSFSFPFHYFNDGTAWAQRSEPKFGNQVIAPVEIRFNLIWIVSKMNVGFAKFFPSRLRHTSYLNNGIKKGGAPYSFIRKSRFTSLASSPKNNIPHFLKFLALLTRENHAR